MGHIELMKVDRVSNRQNRWGQLRYKEEGGGRRRRRRVVVVVVMVVVVVAAAVTSIG